MSRHAAALTKDVFVRFWSPTGGRKKFLPSNEAGAESCRRLGSSYTSKRCGLPQRQPANNTSSPVISSRSAKSGFDRACSWRCCCCSGRVDFARVVAMRKRERGGERERDGWREEHVLMVFGVVRALCAVSEHKRGATSRHNMYSRASCPYICRMLGLSSFTLSR